MSQRNIASDLSSGRATQTVRGTPTVAADALTLRGHRAASKIARPDQHRGKVVAHGGEIVVRGGEVLISAAFALSLALGLIAIRPGAAAAARVSGTLTSYHAQPAVSRDLHFENCVTHDSYLAPTHNDGSFAQSLPPGCYDLRAERGAILRHAIMVGAADVALGQVGDLAPLAPARLLQLEALFPTLLTSPAPSTAYIFTHDATVVPASAAVVPVPTSESEWLKLKKRTEATTGSKSGNGPVPDLSEPLDFGGPKPNAPPNLPNVPPDVPGEPATP